MPISATQPKPHNIRIGEYLLEKKLITQEQLDEALAQQKITNRRLGFILVEMGIIDEDQLLTFLSEQLNTEYVDLTKFTLDPDIVNIIPEIQARRFRVIALENNDGLLRIGMTDPTDVYAFDELVRFLKRPFMTAIVKESVLLKAFDKHYRHTQKIMDLAEEVNQQLGDDDDQLALPGADAENPDAPLIQLLNTMLEDAVNIKVSDIHIEPERDKTRIRFRIDGVLQEQPSASPRLAGALISRLKLMAGLDISEKRLPQDGRFNFTVHKQLIDARLSTMPIQFGESAVMRLLNQTAGIPDLDETGMDPGTLARFRKAIHSTHGIVLVTGPTGSGKTTTLYAALKDINDSSKKIITVEDPVEYQIPGIIQVQVNPKINLDFARVLRSMLRQDPDIALIGEMRDRETIETALRTAMTGHLVLSTLHTGDAASAVVRLIDMGVEPFMIAATLRGILAQRLVRKVCEHCATTTTLSESEQALIASTLGESPESYQFKHGTGCPQCNESGYSGRTMVSEFIEINATLLEALHKGDQRYFIHQVNLQPGFQSLGHSGLMLAARGITSLREAIRLCIGDD